MSLLPTSGCNNMGGHSSEWLPGCLALLVFRLRQTCQEEKEIRSKDRKLQKYWTTVNRATEKLVLLCLRFNHPSHKSEIQKGFWCWWPSCGFPQKNKWTKNSKSHHKNERLSRLKITLSLTLAVTLNHSWTLPWMPNRTVLNMRDERKLSSPIELPTSYFSPCSINKAYWICDHASRIINAIFPSRIICRWFMLLSRYKIQERGTGRRINIWHSMVLLHVSLHRKEIIQAEVCGDYWAGKQETWGREVWRPRKVWESSQGRCCAGESSLSRTQAVSFHNNYSWLRVSLN